MTKINKCIFCGSSKIKKETKQDPKEFDFECFECLASWGTSKMEKIFPKGQRIYRLFQFGDGDGRIKKIFKDSNKRRAGTTL